MRNIIDVDGYKAIVSFDPDIALMRGEFLGLSGGADFYADNVNTLMKEGRKSLKAYLDLCKEKGVEPMHRYSGRFNVRLKPSVHAAAVAAAASRSRSLNEWVAEVIETATLADSQ